MTTHSGLTDTLACRPGTQSSAPARSAGRLQVLLLAFLSAVLPVYAQAACDTSICVGAAETCVISGLHVLDDGCVLDFGSRDVTIAGSATLQSAVPGAAFAIRARDLIVQGLLRAPGASGEGPSIEIDVDRHFRTESVSGSPRTIEVAESAPSGPGWLRVVAAGDVVIAGKHLDGGGRPCSRADCSADSC